MREQVELGEQDVGGLFANLNLPPLSVQMAMK